jgi:tRNA threonylcarbamoyladenosine biosynthesis protein TsaB
VILLALDSATPSSVAGVLLPGGRVVEARDDPPPGSRGEHAARLLPLAEQALAEAGVGWEALDRLAVGVGPGGFTGLRIGIATARALGFAWQAEVRGYPTLALVAAMARAEHAGPVTVCMTGGHGEWFVQDFGADGLPQDALSSLPPADASTRHTHRVIAGSQASAMAAADRTTLDLLPEARFVLSVPEALLTNAISPIYGRAPDARLPG